MDIIACGYETLWALPRFPFPASTSHCGVPVNCGQAGMDGVEPVLSMMEPQCFKKQSEICCPQLLSLLINYPKRSALIPLSGAVTQSLQAEAAKLD